MLTDEFIGAPQPDPYLGMGAPLGEDGLPVVAAPQPVSPLAMLAQYAGMNNVAAVLDEAELARIGMTVKREYGIDRGSMDGWMARMKRGLDLAKLVREDKTYPFPNASNVRYPLITEAAMAFNAKAYPAVVPSGDVVRCAVKGRDPMGQKAARADRVSAHMSHDLTCNVEEWEEETDKLLILLPIVGTVVRKWWHDPSEGRKRCRNILPGKFVVNDRVQVLDDAPRCSEEFELYPSEIADRKRDGRFRDIDYREDEGEEDTLAPQCFIEQHRRIDLDGDGYGEPYIVTIHKETERVARIVADFEPADIKPTPQGGVTIRRGSYFVAYHFVPSMDGGFLGTGLGLLLGDISETINSILNLMLDAGHMASRGGGFIGSEFRIKGGSQQFRPGEWKLATERGGVIKDSIVPMTFPGPDATLFQLLGMLIEAGKAIGAIKDITTGEGQGANQPATTTLALIEQGLAVFTAAYKRIFRSLRQEFKLVAKLNAQTVDPAAYNRFHDAVDAQGNPVGLDPRADYDLSDMDIQPVADPSAVTKMQEAAKAQLVMQMAEQGLVDKQAAARRIMEAASIPEPEALAMKPDPMAQVMQDMQMAAAKAEIGMKMVGIEKALAEIEKLRAGTMDTTMDAATKAQQLLQFDAVAVTLEAIRNGLGAAIAGDFGGMEGAPGNAGGPGLPPPMPGAGAGLPDPRLLGGDGGQGPAGAGGEPTGLPPQAGPPGGPF